MGGFDLIGARVPDAGANNATDSNADTGGGASSSSGAGGKTDATGATGAAGAAGAARHADEFMGLTATPAFGPGPSSGLGGVFPSLSAPANVPAPSRLHRPDPTPSAATGFLPAPAKPSSPALSLPPAPAATQARRAALEASAPAATGGVPHPVTTARAEASRARQATAASPGPTAAAERGSSERYATRATALRRSVSVDGERTPAQQAANVRKLRQARDLEAKAQAAPSSAALREARIEKAVRKAAPKPLSPAPEKTAPAATLEETLKRLPGFLERLHRPPAAGQAARETAADAADAAKAASAHPPAPQLPGVGADAAAANGRIVAALGKSTVNGLHTTYQADALNTGGARATAEYRNFLSQLHAAEPDRVAGYHAEVLDRLTREARATLETHGVGAGEMRRGTDGGGNRPSNSPQSIFDETGGIAVNEPVEPARPPREPVHPLADLDDAGLDPRRPARDAHAEKIEWNEKPDAQLDSGKLALDVKGPVQIEPSGVTAGVDGLRYEVDWLPLDEKGKVIPEWRTSDHKPEPGPPSNFVSKTFHPPYENEHGFRVYIRIPPQPAYNGNSTGVHLNIKTPKGQPAKWVPK